MAYFVAVDDAVVEKLLELLRDVDTGDQSKTELSLKSVAGVLYSQHQTIDSVDGGSVDYTDVSNDLQQMFSTPASAVSSTADFYRETPTSVFYPSSEQLPFSSTTSAEVSDNAVSDTSCAVDNYVSSTLDKPGWNVEHFFKTFLSTSLSGAPHFCVPTVPVISPSVVRAQRGRSLDESVCNSVRENTRVRCNERSARTNDSQNVSLAVAQTVSSTVTRNTPMYSLPNTWTSYSHRALPSMPSLSSSQPILSSGHGHMLQQFVYSHGSNKTVVSTSEAVSRVTDLLAAQCRVLVLMRGCPGSGKSTMAKYVQFVGRN